MKFMAKFKIAVPFMITSYYVKVLTEKARQTEDYVEEKALDWTSWNEVKEKAKHRDT